MSNIELALENAKDCFPICIPSYNRWDRNENKTITKIIEKLPEELQKNTYVFVRKQQKEKYDASFKTVNIIVLPDYITGCSLTRQYMYDYIFEQTKQPYCIDMDDDITDLKYIEYRDGKASLSLKDETKYGQILTLGSEIARIAFEKDNCLLGNFHRVRFANSDYNATHCYTTNKGSTPRQMMFVNIKGLRERDIKRNAMFDNPEIGTTGEDIGFVAEIAKKRGDMFNINCLAYAYVDDALNSVTRNDDNRRILAEYEYECLKKYPIINYLRIPFTYEDGAYKFSDIDFTKYRKLCNKKSVSLELSTLCKIKKWSDSNE